MRRLVLFVLALVVLACHGDNPTSPLDGSHQQHGRLSGVVTIGPNCPVEQQNQPCPTPPSAYDARKVLVYDAARTHVLNTIDIDYQGRYFIDLTPGTYVVDVQKAGLDHTADVPKTVTIAANAIVVVDINIDTGLR